MKKSRDDLHMLTGSYALDALPEPDREEFERHLRHCATCDAEVRGLRETAVRLAMAKAVAPPARLEKRVLTAAYQTRQLPPLTVARPDRGYRPAWAARLTARGRAGTQADGHHRRARLRRLAAAAAVAAMAAGAGLGISQAVTQHQPGPARTAGAAITRVVTAPDARSQTMRTTAGGAITVVVSFRQQAAVVTTAGMRSLPRGRVYQVWVMSRTGARSAGLFSQAGRNGPLLASGVAPGDRIGITIEPAGGTPQPTTAPVVIMPLPD